HPDRSESGGEVHDEGADGRPGHGGNGNGQIVHDVLSRRLARQGPCRRKPQAPDTARTTSWRCDRLRGAGAMSTAPIVMSGTPVTPRSSQAVVVVRWGAVSLAACALLGRSAVTPPRHELLELRIARARITGRNAATRRVGNAEHDRKFLISAVDALL